MELSLGPARGSFEEELGLGDHVARKEVEGQEDQNREESEDGKRIFDIEI